MNLTEGFPWDDKIFRGCQRMAKARTNGEETLQPAEQGARSCHERYSKLEILQQIRISD